MTLHVHRLAGCAPVPLAHYLKALGILRIIAEQVDFGARGWWQDDQFFLLTKLSRTEVEEFFLRRYSPTPFVSPWNKGSGFFAADDPGLGPLERSVADRFAVFRQGIAEARAQIGELQRADAAVRSLKDKTKVRKRMSQREAAEARALKDDPAFKRQLAEAERKFKRLKQDVLAPFRLTWRGLHREWMDAALIALEGGDAAYPSLLGTGGNDGRLDFTNNAMQVIGELFDLASPNGDARSNSHALLAESLWSETSSLRTTRSIGQFLPGAAGGANSTTGSDGPPHVNPWDFLLMLEGTLLFSARATKRFDANGSMRASAPFAVHAHSVGNATSGAEAADRGEQWMPIWTRPCALGDLRATLGEGRLQIGRRTADRPIDAALAMSRLGVARGITSFVRYAYLERNGQSNLAVPIGRIDVRERPRSRLVDDLAPWLVRLERIARDGKAPARFLHAERKLSNAVLEALQHDDHPLAWQSLLVSAVEIESIQLGGSGTQAGPIPPLSPEWLVAANDGTPEWRLAAALGSAAASYVATRPIDPVRHHWLPLRRGARGFLEKERRLVRDPRVVMQGRDPIADCLALVQRRLVEAVQRGSRRLPLVSADGWGARPSDLARLLAGDVDLARVSILARGLMAVRWDRASAIPAPQYPARGEFPDDAWVALRLAHLARPPAPDMQIPVDEAIVRRLSAGDAATAVELALRRLRASGVRARIQGTTLAGTSARLWGAAIAFPIDRLAMRAFVRRFNSVTSKEN